MPRSWRGEKQLQAKCAGWLRAAGVLFLHPPNEGRHKKHYYAQQIAMGMHPGAADLIIFTPPPAMSDCPGAALELKVGKNKPTSAQLEFLASLRALGWAVAWARDEDEARATLERWGYI